MNVRWKNKTNRHLNHRWESFNWNHPCLSSFLNVIINTAKEPEIAKDTQRRQNTYRKGVRPPQDRSMHGQIVLMQIVSRITFDIIWSLYEPFLRQFRRQLMWRRSRTYPPMRYTVDFRQLEPSLTRTSRLLEPKSISPGFSSYIYCNCTLRNSTSR